MWKKAKNGLFSVNSSFDTLKGGRTVSFPNRMIWNQCVSTKIVLFLVFFFFFCAWEAWSGKIMTLDQLKRRGHSLANSCFLRGGRECRALFTSLFYGLGAVGFSVGRYGCCMGAPLLD